jgi:hypothetical protein
MRLIRKRWNRRNFMKAAGIGAAAGALSSWVPTLSAEADGTTPRRLLLLSHGNGSVLEQWRNNGDNPFVDDRALPALEGPILEPLDRHRDKLLLLDGIDLSIHEYVDGNFRRTGSKGHAGSSVLFTGQNGGGTSFEGDAGSFPSSASIDQLINQRIGEGRRSLQLSVWNRPLDPRSVYNYGEGGAPLPLEPNPQIAFDEVFRDGFGDAPTVDRRGPRRERTLALLRGQLSRLERELPADDRVRLARHVEGLDALEARLATAPAVTCSASEDDRPSIARDYRDDTPATLRAQMDVLLHAFACDQVRVATLQLIPENSWSSAPFLPEWSDLGGGGVHTVSHLQNQDPSDGRRRDAVEQMSDLNRFCASWVATLLDDLETFGLMEDTLVVWAPAMSHGGYHSNQNVPFVIAQGEGGPFRANRYLRWGDYDQPADGGARLRDAGNAENNDLLISICHAMGLEDVETVGDTRHCTAGGLDGRLF